jgi:hypothetical protein
MDSTWARNEALHHALRWVEDSGTGTATEVVAIAEVFYKFLSQDSTPESQEKAPA